MWTDEQRAEHARKRKLWWDSRTAEQKAEHGRKTSARERARREAKKRASEEKKTDSP